MKTNIETIPQKDILQNGYSNKLRKLKIFIVCVVINTINLELFVAEVTKSQNMYMY